MPELRNYQKEGVEFLRNIGCGLCGDEPGLGKSAEIIHLTKDAPKVLVLTMSSLKFQFAEEIKSWLPKAKVIVINGSQQERYKQWDGDYQYYIANYELLLRYDWGRMKKIPWDYICADECTRLSNHSNKQYRALKAIPSQYRIAMTGTAISNSPTDAYGIFEWLYPGIFKNYYAFMNRYTIKSYWGAVVDFKNMDHLKATITPYYIRRTKEQVLPELPEKIQSVIPVELSDKERKLYDQLRMALLFDIEQADVSKIKNLTQIQNGITKMLRLRQACNSLELLGESKESSKLVALKELLSTLNGGKKIIFTEFSTMADILERELPGSLKITGDIATEERNEIVKKFNGPDYNILIGTKAVAYGLNLQASSYIIHFDLPWSCAAYAQRAARAHRLGQKNTVYEYSLVCRHSIDEYVQKKLEKKQDIAEQLMPITEIREMLLS